jgi:O-antigen ligase
VSGVPPEAVAWSAADTDLYAERRSLVSWELLLAGIVGLVFLVPIKRYAMPGDLPFGLEPYRVVVAAVVLAWLAALLVDPRVRLRRSCLDLPLLAFAGSALASVAVNPASLDVGEAEVIKQTLFLLSFVLLYFLIVSVVRSEAQVIFLVKVLVLAGGVVGALAIVESSTGYNVFNHLGSIPLLTLTAVPDLDVRGTALRAYASAQHPIALGAVLVMVIPLSAALVRATGRVRWWVPAWLLGLGAVSSVSRTAVLMLGTVLLVGSWMRPRETVRLWAALVPAALLVYLFVPTALQSLEQAFAPEGGLIAEQHGAAGRKGSGRLADVAPALDEFSRKPLLGQGYGSRDVEDEHQTIPILDNQWLGTLLETGLLGLLGLVWLLLRFLRRCARAARRDGAARGSLLAAFATATAAYGVGMLTFDSFSFIQVTFVFFIVLGLGSALLGIRPDSTESESPGAGRASRAAGRGGGERAADL